MDLLRNSALVWGISLDEEQLVRFERYYQELLAWNRHTNLTRITDYREVQIRHFLDSLSLLAAIPGRNDRSSQTLIDVGSGPGLPGLALKIARPWLRVTLVESVRKKAEFLRHVLRVLALDGVEVVCERAEVAAREPRHREQYDLVTARALAELPVALELTAPFARIGGRILLPRQGDMDSQVATADTALAALGVGLEKMVPVQLPDVTEGRAILAFRKTSLVDARFPRRAGIPRKRPLR